MDRREFRFDFIVSGATEEWCDELLQKLIKLVESCGGQVSGGFSEVKDEQEEPGSTENRD